MFYWKAKSVIISIVFSSVLPACSTGSYLVPKSEMDRVRAASADQRSRMIVAAKRVSDGEGVDLRAKTIDVSTALATTRNPDVVAVKATAMSPIGIVGAAVGASGLVPIGVGSYLYRAPCEGDVDCVFKGSMGSLLIIAGIGMNITGVVLMVVGADRRPQELGSRGTNTAYGPQVVLAPGGVGFRTPLW
jgi:hypothetical protein